MSLQRLPIAPALLYDGFNNGFYTLTYAIQTPPGTVTIRPAFDSQPLDELSIQLPAADFAQLLREGHFLLRGQAPFQRHVGSDELPLRFYRHDGQLFVFASGEFQPGRYKIYLDGVWQVGL